jgi:hypothetical protein
MAQQPNNVRSLTAHRKRYQEAAERERRALEIRQLLACLEVYISEQLLGNFTPAGIWRDTGRVPTLAELADMEARLRGIETELIVVRGGDDEG